MRISKNTLVFVVIYLSTFAIILQYNLSHPLVNDNVFEYRDYLANIAVGWQYRNSSLNSCLIPVWFPSLIQRWTGWNPLLVFRLFPPFFYALMPAFVYLIAKRYLALKYAVISALVVVCSSYVLYFPDVGRIGIALGFMSGMVWALLERKLIWASVFAILVVFSHYGAAVIAIGITGSVLGCTLLLKWIKPKLHYGSIKPYLTTFCVLVILTWVWHFGIAKYSGDTMFTTMLQPWKAKAIMGQDWGEMNIFDMGSRDAVAQKAFGVTLPNEPIPGKIEIASNWLVVVFLSLGLLIMLRNKTVDIPFKIMALALYGLIMATVIIPQFSNYYGTIRVFFTALTLLAICFPFGIRWVAGRIHMSPFLLSAVVLILYAVSTSGAIYLPFGLVKVLPVVITYP